MTIHIIVERNLIDGSLIFKDCFTHTEYIEWKDRNGYVNKSGMIYDALGFEVGMDIRFEKEV